MKSNCISCGLHLLQNKHHKPQNFLSVVYLGMKVMRKICTHKYISFLSGGICSEPADILNGRHSVLGGTQQQLHYQCDPGFLLWGASDLVCLANNTYVNAIILIYCVLTVYIDKEWTCTITMVGYSLSQRIGQWGRGCQIPCGHSLYGNHRTKQEMIIVYAFSAIT